MALSRRGCPGNSTRREFLRGSMAAAALTALPSAVHAEPRTERGSQGHRILVVNPNTSETTTAQIRDNARRYARRDTRIQAVQPDEGPEIILGSYENDLATAAVLHKVGELDPASYDAVVVAAYSDSGLWALRELLEVPVLGIAESSMAMGSMLGYRFTILSFVERLRPFFHELVGRYNHEANLASIRMVDLRADQLRDEQGKPHPDLADVGREAIVEDGAEVILLGGATLAGLDRALREALGVPVVDGVVAAVKFAESLLDYGLSPSKVRAFRAPESLREQN